MLLSADGALEAAPAMGAADIILDLVSTGVTLRENNLKQIDGGDILDVRASGTCSVAPCCTALRQATAATAPTARDRLRHCIALPLACFRNGMLCSRAAILQACGAHFPPSHVEFRL